MISANAQRSVTGFLLGAAAAWLLGMAAVHAQTDERGSARGAPWPGSDGVDLPFVGATVPYWNFDYAVAKGGETPRGVAALERDIFTSDDFYIDKESWTDPRYFRCNSPASLDGHWGDFLTGPRMIVDDNPATGAWGHCDRDIPREHLLSPYPFDTAQTHYEALMAEAVARGGPSMPSYDELEFWQKRYQRNLELSFAASGFVEGEERAEDVIPAQYHEHPQWTVGLLTQASTIVSLLTEEYQQRYVQMFYHQLQGNTRQWSLMYCRPEGFMREWSGPGFAGLEIIALPNFVELASGFGGNRYVYVGRQFDMEGAVPRLGDDLRQWHGETIGFWDEGSLITWTSNVRGWFTHGSFEHSDYLQTIEIFSPRFHEGEFIGLQHETVFYDPEALVAPLRDLRFLSIAGELTDGPPRNQEYCQQTIFSIDGKERFVTPGEVIEFKMRNLDRPWAQIYEEYFEDGMQRPAQETDIFSFD